MPKAIESKEKSMIEEWKRQGKTNNEIIKLIEIFL
jgi:hypothetical protein